jgi:uncharacterized protein with HEPN domain
VSRDERQRLEDVRDALEAIEGHMERPPGEGGAQDDPMRRDALLFQFVVIGEAVKNLSDETRRSAPEVPWASVAGPRDLIAHEYFRIEMTRIVEVVERDVPRLRAAVERLLGERHP